MQYTAKLTHLHLASDSIANVNFKISIDFDAYLKREYTRTRTHNHPCISRTNMTGTRNVIVFLVINSSARPDVSNGRFQAVRCLIGYYFYPCR